MTAVGSKWWEVAPEGATLTLLSAGSGVAEFSFGGKTLTVDLFTDTVTAMNETIIHPATKHTLDEWVKAVTSGETIESFADWHKKQTQMTDSVVVKMPIYLYVQVHRATGKIISAVVDDCMPGDDCMPIVVTDETTMYYADPNGVPSAGMVVTDEDRIAAAKSLRTQEWPARQIGW